MWRLQSLVRHVLTQQQQQLVRLRQNPHWQLACSRFSSSEASCSSTDDTDGEYDDDSGMGIGAWLKTLPAVPRREVGPKGEPIKMTASKWVARCLPEVPASTISRLFRKRTVRVQAPALDAESGLTVTKYRRVTRGAIMPEGAVICVPTSATVVKSGKPEPEGPSEEDIESLRQAVIYKDEDIIVLNKPPGLAVQGGSKIEKSIDSIMATALTFDSQEGPRLVHRLDKDVSGAMILGRTYKSTVRLQDIICSKDGSNGSVGKGLDRKYIALVIGFPMQEKGLINAPLLKMVLDDGKSDRVLIAADPRSENAIPAITEYQVLKRSVLGCTWIQLRPITGRKHQLRVHCAQALGLPIVGDLKYGFHAHKRWFAQRDLSTLDPQDLKARKKMKGSVVAKHPMLHLHSRMLTIPRLRRKAGLLESGEDPVKMKFVAPLPEHMERSWYVKPLIKGRPEKPEGWGWTEPKRVLRERHMEWQRTERKKRV